MDQGKRAAFLALLAGLGLVGCQEVGGPQPQWAHLSPAGQSIAFDSIEGPPSDLRTELAGELAAAAAERRVDVAAEARTARYRIKGYLTTETNEDGATSLAFVWDLFDADRRRAKRVAGSSPIRAAAAEPWQGLDREALRKLAQRSMDEIAVFLASRNDPAPPG